MFYLEELKLNNFRCYKNYKNIFSPAINIIIGDNAVGKTSIIESVHALGVSKSHKAISDLEMIKYDADFCFVKGNFIDLDDNKKTEVVYSITQQGKQIVKNGKKIKKISEYIGFFYTVLFCPEDIEIIKGAPSSRRKFLDVNIGQIDCDYLMNLIKYKKILKQRNQLLKEMSENQKFDEQLLEILTTQLIAEAEKIVAARTKFVEDINNSFNKCVENISSGKEEVKIVYKPCCEVDKMWKTFEEKKKLDLITKTTNAGPHRDDFEIYFNDKKSDFASQGQQKTFVLALKLALIDVIKKINNKIIVILDDVFGELDTQRQKKLIKLLDMDYQIFITTTNIDHLDEEILKKSKIIKICKDGE